MDADIKSWRRELTWYKFLSEDSYGERSYDTASIVHAVMKVRTQTIRDRAGKEVISQSVLYFDEIEGDLLSDDDQLELDDERRVNILYINPIYDEYGNLDTVEVFI